MLGQDSSQDPDEQEFIMAMHKTWEEARAELRAEGEANALLTVLRVRGIAVSDAVRKQILAQKDLQRWGWSAGSKRPASLRPLGR
jgi:hypothetical protein